MPQTALILLSRQSLRPVGTDLWVQQACRAVQWVKQQGMTLVTSVGMQSWELLVYLARINQVPQILILPQLEGEDLGSSITSIRTDFELASSRVEIIPVYAKSRQEGMKARDAKALAIASLLIPVSIRPGGAMDEALGDPRYTGRVQSEFRVDYGRKNAPLGYSICMEDLNPVLRDWEGRYLIHWTRSSNGKWPTERAVDYYESVTDSSTYCRSAFETLKDLLRTGTILGSSRHMPAQTKTVSFTSTSFAGMIPLMRWRTRYREMSFEPYGIGIDKDWAVSNNILFPVQYYHPREGHPDCDEWLTQTKGKTTSWEAESEWRCLGNFDLSIVPDEKIVLVCRLSEELPILKKHCGVQVESFCSKPDLVHG